MLAEECFGGEKDVLRLPAWLVTWELAPVLELGCHHVVESGDEGLLISRQSAWSRAERRAWAVWTQTWGRPEQVHRGASG